VPQRISNGEQMPDSQVHATAAYRRLVHGTNINEQTLLATDYLNHFNEITMLLELVPDMPDCLEDVREWEPKTYQEHFQVSSFSDKELVIAAYEHAPKRYRVPFDLVVARINDVVLASVERIAEAVDSQDDARLRDTVQGISQELQQLIDKASAIIHGDEATTDQLRIDEIMSG
jgi:hypothetical protein